VDSKKLLRTLTVNRGSILAPLIDSYQARGKFPDKWEIEIRNTREPDSHFHPSGDCYTDPRHLYLEKTGQIKPQRISSALRRTFDVGHMWHGYIQAMLVDMGLVAPDNVEKTLKHKLCTIDGTDYWCKGTADLVDVHIPGHGYWLVDIKTMNSTNFANPPEDTMKKYRAQVNMYGDWTGSDKMLILAVNKDSPHDFREFIVPKDEDVLVDVYTRWTYVAECIASKSEPGLEH
jgi:hypothetical protein